MRVLILAAGFGTRLRPLTETTPKCLVTIGEKPMLKHWLEKIDNCEINPSEVFVNLHYKKELVENFIKQQKYKFPIIPIIEEELIGTGGTFFNLIKHRDNKNLLVIHCDNYYEEDLDNFLKFSLEKINCYNFDMSILAFRTDEPENCGTMLVKDDGEVLQFEEKVRNPKTNLANGAVYFFSSKYIKSLKKEFTGLKDIARDLLANKHGKIAAFETQSYFCDIGTLARLEKTRSHLTEQVQ